MQKTSLWIAALALGLPLAAQARLNLYTQKGAKELGGHITLSIDRVSPDQGDSVSGQTLSIAPRFGYFVIDNLEVLVGANLGLGFGDLYKDSSTTYGFEIGGRYVIALQGPMRPYVGVLFGMDWTKPSEGDATSQTVITVPLGVWFPLLNEHVALDAGLRIQYRIADKVSYLNIPIGYLGVVALW